MPTDRATLLALAEKVEALTTPNRDIDAEIAPLMGIRVVDEGHPLGRCYYDEKGHGVPLPLFTSSVDAAMTLAPPHLRLVTLTEIAAGEWGAKLGNRNGPGGLPCAADKTAALAMTAAALRAQAEALGHE